MGNSSGRLASAEGTSEKYRVLAALGEGGMANVYLAVARGPAGFNKLIVLKAIKEELALDPELLTMFLDEARLAARLSHPNVVQTLEVGDLQGRPVIVMEYLDGQPLSQILFKPEAREMNLAMKLRILAAAIEGLHYIHELADFDGTPLQLVHRDISPHNVFVTFDGQVKLLDFGICKGLISNGRTRTDVLKGKIRYMAPEQMCAETVDRRADIFSAGVILWEIATGERIWQARSEVNVMHAVLNEGVPAPRTVAPQVSPELNDVCVKALATAKEDRYQTAAELLAALDSLLDHMGSRVMLKHVGQFLATAFAESRARTKETIETELKRLDAGLTGPGSGRFTFPSRLVSLAPTTETASAGPLPAPAPRRARWIGLAGAVAAGAVVGGVLTLNRAPGAATPAPPASRTSQDPSVAPSTAQSPPATPSATEPATVEVRIAATPAAAAIFVDGKPIDGNPYVGTFPRDGSHHTVRAEAPGYVAATADVVLDSDVKLMLPLSPVKGPALRPASPRASSSAAAPVATASAAPPPPNTDCTPPFYFDAQGIKRLKPECI
jgi:serine/threonine-protein kinase